MKESTRKAIVSTMADMIRLRIIEFTPVDTAYKSLILSYTETLVAALSDFVDEHGDDEDTAAYDVIVDLMITAVAESKFLVLDLS